MRTYYDDCLVIVLLVTNGKRIEFFKQIIYYTLSTLTFRSRLQDEMCQVLKAKQLAALGRCLNNPIGAKHDDISLTQRHL